MLKNAHLAILPYRYRALENRGKHTVLTPYQNPLNDSLSENVT